MVTRVGRLVFVLLLNLSLVGALIVVGKATIRQACGVREGSPWRVRGRGKGVGRSGRGRVL